MAATRGSIVIPQQMIVKHNSDFFRNGFLSMTIIGKSGCGKTEMLASILPGISLDIKTIFIATVIKDAPAHIAIKNYFLSHGVYCGITHDPFELRASFNMAADNQRVSLNRPGLVIFDDFNTGRATGPFWDVTIHAFTKLRNNGWHFILLAQQPSFVPTIVRNCTTARVLFDCYSKSALTSFTRDVKDRVSDQSAYEGLIEYIQKIPYSYMLVRERPFDISAGKGGNIRSVINGSSVVMPTLQELMNEIGVKSKAELDTKSKMLQREAGNDSRHLF